MYQCDTVLHSFGTGSTYLYHSLHEVPTAFLHEKFGFTRSRAAWLVTTGSLIIGVVSSLALGDWNDVRIAGMNLFDALDFLTAKIMLPVAGMFVAIFVSWKLDQKKVREEVTNWGTLRAPYYPLLIFLLRYLTPIGILLVFVNELGWL